MPTTSHVYREHVLDGGPCWCNPKHYVPCDEHDEGSCWKCNEQGLIELTAEEYAAETRGTITVHN